MAEKMKARISKWDVAAELHLVTVVHDGAPPAEVDDSCTHLTDVDSIKPIVSMNVDGSEMDLKEVDSIKPIASMKIDGSEIDLKEEDSIKPIVSMKINCSEIDLKKEDSIKPIVSMKIDGSEIDLKEVDSINPIVSMKVDGSEIDLKEVGYIKPIVSMNVDGGSEIDLTEMDSIKPIVSMNVEGSEIDLKEVDSIKPILSINVDGGSEIDLKEVDSIKPILSMNVNSSELNQSASQSVGERSNNITHSDDICEKTQYSEQLDLEGDCKDGLKKQDLEPASQDRTMSENAENQDKEHKAAYDMPPGLEERHSRNRNMLPIDDRRRSSRKRSRSLSYDSRSRSWSRSRSRSSRSRSRSRSPSHVSKQGSERWMDKGRMRGMTPACRAFAAGMCKWGSQCRFLHEGDGWRQIDRHHDSGLTDERGSRHERERLKETITDTREKSDYTREKPFKRHEEHHEDGRGDSLPRQDYRSNEERHEDGRGNSLPRQDYRSNEERHEDGRGNSLPRQGYRFNERCFDFFVGRCHRGAACRYIHQDASSPDGGSSVRDESRGRFHDHRGGSSYFNRKDVPCKYFLRGNCVHGEGCKYYHQVGPLNTSAERSLNGGQHGFTSGGPAGNIGSANGSGLQDQTPHSGAFKSPGENESKVGDTKPVDKKKITNRSICDTHPALRKDVHKEAQPSEQKTATTKVCDEISANNPLPTILIAGQNSVNRGRSQFAPQFLHAQNFAQQALHSHPQNGKNQFAGLLKPPANPSFNTSIENLSANPSSYPLNPQKLDFRGQTQQNLPMMPRSGSNFNPNKQIQQNGPLIHNARNQADFKAGGQIQQNLTSHIGAAGDSQQILPQNQVQGVPPHVSNGQNHPVVPQPSNPPVLNSGEKNCESTTKNASMQIDQGADSSEVNPPSSAFNSDNSIIHKLVTSEQAAKITDLSASLAQFFGAAAAMAPQPFLNPSSIGSFVPTVPQLPAEVDQGSQTNLSRPIPKPNQQIHAIEVEKIKQVDDSSSREVKKIEAHGINKEQPALSHDCDAEGRKDGDGKKIKEVKEMRMFKCTLVEFVKDILKPKWKEGQLSKEAYKTIVKKVVDKVCGSLQGSIVPQTQEKIDLYLLNSKPKLSKLVQAYVEKFVNS